MGTSSKVYRVQRDEALKRAEKAEARVKYLESGDTAWWITTVYCENCKWVSEIKCPPGWTIDGGDCANCRARGRLHFVYRVNASRSF
jgi:hypothetical protein